MLQSKQIRLHGGLQNTASALLRSPSLNKKRSFMTETFGLLPAYEYRALRSNGEIRVLGIQPAKDLEDPIVCRMCYLATDKPAAAFEYEALSYYWGSSPEYFYIQVYDDRQRDKICRLLVTENLDAALRRMRHPDQERLVWTDAACINQNDSEEKVIQIGMMGKIYTDASGVIVFLGDTHETEQVDIDESIDCVLELNKLVYERWQKYYAIDKNFDPYPVCLGTIEIFFWTVSEEESLQRWWALLQLFQRPWFFRVWIMQELILAKTATVIWGARTISWNKVFGAAQLISLASHRLLLPFEPKYTGVDTALLMGSWKPPMGPTDTLKKRMGPPDSGNDSDMVPLTTMLIFRNFHATVSNDKFNAVLGLLEGRSIIGPSDSTKETPAKLFHRLATTFIAAFAEVFMILSWVDGVPESSREAIPSWVPDWSQTDIPQPWRTFRWENKCIFNASGTSKQNLNFDSELKVLRVAGKVFGVLSEVSSVYDPPVRNHDSLKDGAHLARETRSRTKACLDEYIDIFNRHAGDDLPSDEPSTQTFFWQLLICGRAANAAPAREEEAEFFFKFLDFYSDPAIYLNMSCTREMFEHSEDAGRFEALMKDWSMANRRFFATREGRFGWAPRYAQPGDLLVILAGAEVPYVLRPTGKYGHEYRLLGEGYLHGFMDGRAFETDERPLQHFYIV